MRAVRGARRPIVACSLAIPVALVLAAAPARAAECPFADAQAGQATPDILDQTMVCLINQQRAAAGLSALPASPVLADTATRYAAYMVANKNFGHTDLQGHDVRYRVEADAPAVADTWALLGENLGWGDGTLSTPRAIVNRWMGSSEHRANVLEPTFNEIGVGVDDGSPDPSMSGGRTYVAVFGD